MILLFHFDIIFKESFLNTLEIKSSSHCIIFLNRVCNTSPINLKFNNLKKSECTVIKSNATQITDLYLSQLISNYGMV